MDSQGIKIGTVDCGHHEAESCAACPQVLSLSAVRVTYLQKSSI